MMIKKFVKRENRILKKMFAAIISKKGCRLIKYVCGQMVFCFLIFWYMKILLPGLGWIYFKPLYQDILFIKLIMAVEIFDKSVFTMWWVVWGQYLLFLLKHSDGESSDDDTFYLFQYIYIYICLFFTLTLLITQICGENMFAFHFTIALT